MNTPIPFTFTEDGLVKDMVYHYRDDGSVNWRAMLLPEHFAVNTRRFAQELATKHSKPAEQLAVTDVEDKYLLIYLAGFRYLARIRGALSVEPTIVASSPTFASVRTLITWRPNPETGGMEAVSGGCANASVDNVSPMVRGSLEAIAENKAFVRAVRSYLEIPILGYDEVNGDDKGGATEGTAPSTTGQFSLLPHGHLEKVASDKGWTLEKVKRGALAHRGDIESDPNSWTQFKDVPPRDCLTIIDLINTKR